MNKFGKLCMYGLWILEVVYDLITKSYLSVWKAAEQVLIHWFQSFKTFTCNTHEAIAWKITNSTALNIYLNNKRKICTDSVAANGLKALRKGKGKRVLIKIYCFYFFLGLCF